MLSFKKSIDSIGQKGRSNTKYRSVSLPYYSNGWENEEFEQRAQSFESSIHYGVEKKITI
jgi:hypothetical protein